MRGFRDVVKYLKEGHYARRSVWGRKSYIYWNEKLNKILTNSGNEICLDNLKTAEDWIIIVDKKYRKVVWAELDKPIRPEEQSDVRKDESDGILSICTLGASSVVKGVVKSIKKAGEELDD